LTSQVDFPRFAWSNFEQSLVLSSLQLGTAITLIPGALLAQKFGGKEIIGIFFYFYQFETFLGTQHV